MKIKCSPNGKISHNLVTLPKDRSYT